MDWSTFRTSVAWLRFSHTFLFCILVYNTPPVLWSSSVSCYLIFSLKWLFIKQCLTQWKICKGIFWTGPLRSLLRNGKSYQTPSTPSYATRLWMSCKFCIIWFEFFTWCSCKNSWRSPLKVLRKYRETESMESLNMHLFKVLRPQFSLETNKLLPMFYN